MKYPISLVIRWGLLPSKSIPKIKNPSYKMDLDFFGLFWKGKILDSVRSPAYSSIL